MKTSLVMAIIILGIGLMAGTMQQRQLAERRQTHKQLVAQALRFGIRTTDPNPAVQPRIASREIHDREIFTRSVVAQISDYGRALDDDEWVDGENSPAVQELGWDLMERLMDLDPEDLKNIIGSLQADEDLPHRRELIDLSVRMLAENHPAAALSVLVTSKDIMKGMDDGTAVIGESIENWAKQDPVAALAWVHENSEKDLPLSREDMESKALAGAAQLDPQLAFRLLSKVKTNLANAIQTITGSARSPEDRTLILTALHNHLGTVSNPEERDALLNKALGGFAETFCGEDFVSVRDWISNQNFSESETDHLVRGLSFDATKAETGKWIEWMADALPPEAMEERVGALISPWAQEECQAAGKWINEQPDGPVKTAAVNAFARAVGKFDPQIAAEWAVTLPGGQAREETLKHIYMHWHKKDAAAANSALGGMGLPLETIESLKKQSGVIGD
jgi:hypothetical protein